MQSELKTREQIFDRLVEVLSKTFEFDPARVTLETNLYTDLDIDSIDAVDLFVKLQQLTGKRLKPETFKSARTVRDVVDAISALIPE